MMSTPVPAPAGRTSVIGLEGYFAWQKPAKGMPMVAVANRAVNDRRAVLFMLRSW
jgi:hypothetical protein